MKKNLKLVFDFVVGVPLYYLGMFGGYLYRPVHTGWQVGINSKLVEGYTDEAVELQSQIGDENAEEN